MQCKQSFQVTHVLLALLGGVSCKIWDVLDYGVIESDPSLSTCNANTKILNRLLNEQLQPGDILLIPHSNHFWFNGGIFASSMDSITIQIDGAIHYQHNREDWPIRDGPNPPHLKSVLEAMRFVNSSNITITSSYKTQKGLIHGHGSYWWGAEEYCEHKENRPRLLHIYNSTDLVIEYLFFKDSPYWHVYLEDVKNVEIHHTNISAKRDANADHHDLFELTAFNTDGFDVSGENVWIHDVDIWNDDDCIAVKAQSGKTFQSNCSRNMLFERITASGLGLTIGSIGPSLNHSCIDNITFRNVSMYKTWKGIYMKSSPGKPLGSGVISNVLYENIVMDQPQQVPIWIGPQQAIYDGQCSLLWPYSPWAKCPVTPFMSWFNITLRNIIIHSPKQSPGLLLGSSQNPMTNITFDNVVVHDPGMSPWGTDYYKCEGVKQFEAVNGTNPVPRCGHSIVDLHGVEVATTWQQKLNDIPGLDKYLALVMCLEHTAMQSNPMEGHKLEEYEPIEFHMKEQAVLSSEQSMELTRIIVVFMCCMGCASCLLLRFGDL